MEKFNSPSNIQERHIRIPEKVRIALKGMRNSAIAGSALVFAVACGGEKNNTPVVTETQSVTTTATEVITPQPTLIETVTPTEKPTEPPQTKTPRPTKTPAPTDTPTATETSVESELPYEIGSKLTVGNVTLAVTKDMQTRTECGDPYGRALRLHVLRCRSSTLIPMTSQTQVTNSKKE